MARTHSPLPPPPTLVLLVRHGQTPTTGKLLPGPRARPAPAPTSAPSRRKRAAERIAELQTVDAIYASPLERTRETAAPIARRVGVKVQIDKGLLECDFGEWTGAELKKLMKLPEWRTVQRAPSHVHASRAARASPRCRPASSTRSTGCAPRTQAASIVCVSHADPIKAAVAHAMGTHIDLFQRIVISTCSVTAIAYGCGGPVVLTVNSTGGSLAELRPS